MGMRKNEWTLRSEPLVREQTSRALSGSLRANRSLRSLNIISGELVLGCNSIHSLRERNKISPWNSDEVSD